MKITVTTYSDKMLEKRDYRQALDIKMEDDFGKTKTFSVADGEPEDSNLRRDFNDCLSIPDLLEFAFECGKQDKSFSIERVKAENYF